MFHSTISLIPHNIIFLPITKAKFIDLAHYFNFNLIFPQLFQTISQIKIRVFPISTFLNAITHFFILLILANHFLIHHLIILLILLLYLLTILSFTLLLILTYRILVFWKPKLYRCIYQVILLLHILFLYNLQFQTN